VVTFLEPQSLCTVATDERKRDLLSGSDASLGFAGYLNDRLGVHRRGAAAFSLEFPSPTDVPSHNKARTFDPRGKLLFKSVAIQMFVCCYSNLIGPDARALLVSTDTEKPTTDQNRKRVKHGCLPGGVVADEQVEPWIESKGTALKAVEIMDRQIVNLHG
jgi:hypothetical protein